MAQSTARKLAKGTLGVVGVGGLGLALALERTVRSEVNIHPPHFPWSHYGVGQSIDVASARRGYQVYKQVCAACHSVKYLAFRQLVGFTHTKEQAKSEAKSFQIEDGPDDEGKMFMRSGKLFDFFPSPYPNDEAAKFANNGAAPPDLSLITRARHGNENYLFSLLTSYCDPPAGFVLQEGLSYNPYFPGKAIAMPPPLYNEAVTYTDGTPATMSQMAKDVTIFLAWNADKKHDERKMMQLKFLLLVPFILFPMIYKYNHVASYYRARKFVYSTLGTRHWGGRHS